MAHFMEMQEEEVKIDSISNGLTANQSEENAEVHPEVEEVHEENFSQENEHHEQVEEDNQGDDHREDGEEEAGQEQYENQNFDPVQDYYLQREASRQQSSQVAKSSSALNSNRRSSSPSHSLLRTTKARIEDSRKLEEHKKEVELQKATPSPKPTSKYTPSQTLLRTTQARIADIREWESHRERTKYDDDIWWEQRRPFSTVSMKLDVPSKLYELTTATVAGKRDKFTPEKVQATQAVTPTKKTVEIDPNNRLLKTTKTVTRHSWATATDNSPPPPPPKLVLASQATGPSHVTSKLHYKTNSATMHEWKSDRWNESIEKEKTKEKEKTSPRVKATSDRLLAPNTATKAARREKAKRRHSDPREVGWNRFTHKDTIPPLEALDNGGTLPNLHGSLYASSFALSETPSRSTLDAIQVEDQDTVDNDDIDPHPEEIDSRPLADKEESDDAVDREVIIEGGVKEQTIEEEVDVDPAAEQEHEQANIHHETLPLTTEIAQN